MDTIISAPDILTKEWTAWKRIIFKRPHFGSPAEWKALLYGSSKNVPDPFAKLSDEFCEDLLGYEKFLGNLYYDLQERVDALSERSHSPESYELADTCYRVREKWNMVKEMNRAVRRFRR